MFCKLESLFFFLLLFFLSLLFLCTSKMISRASEVRLPWHFKWVKMKCTYDEDINKCSVIDRQFVTKSTLNMLSGWLSLSTMSIGVVSEEGVLLFLMQCFFLCPKCPRRTFCEVIHTRIFFLDACLAEQSWGGPLLSFVVDGAAGDTCSVYMSCLIPLRSASELAGWLLDNKVTCLAAQISFVCDAIFLATISPNFASWCQSANGRSIRKLYRFFCFSPTFLSRSQLISSASNRSLCRICNTNHLSTSIPVPNFPGCALYSIDLLFLLASRLAINILSVAESFIQYLLFVFLSHRKKRSRMFVQYGDMDSVGERKELMMPRFLGRSDARRTRGLSVSSWSPSVDSSSASWRTDGTEFGGGWYGPGIFGPCTFLCLLAYPRVSGHLLVADTVLKG